MRKLNPYLREKVQSSKKTTEDCERLGRRLRLGSNLAPTVYQFRGPEALDY